MVAGVRSVVPCVTATRRQEDDINQGAVMRRQVTLAVALFVAAVAMGRVASAAPPTENRDAGFLKTVAEAELFEQKIGQYAADHGVTQEVKDVGRRLADDHRKSDEKLRKLARDENVDLSKFDRLSPSDQTVYNRLTAMRGVDFDREFTKLTI